MELRCSSKKHAEIIDEVIEIKCNSKFCGAAPGVTILHRFNLAGVLIETKKYRDPRRNNGTRNTAAVRAS